MQGKKISIKGISSQHLYGNSLSLVTFIEAIDLINYFSVFDVPAELEPVFQSIHSKKNIQRLSDNVTSISNGITNLSPTPSLVFAIGGNVDFDKAENQLSTITYDPANTLIIDGALSLFALMELMGFTHPFVKKRASKKSIEKNSKIRQEIAQLPVQVTLIFNHTIQRNSSNLFDIFKLYNKKETRIHSPSFDVVNNDDAINDYIKVITKSVNLDSYGGMTNLTSRLTKSEPYITTESTMIRMVLGALGGAEAQDKNKISEFGLNVNSFKEDSSILLQPLIINFMKAWLEGIKKQLIDRDGYHYSPQIWQSLGLVIHNLVKTKMDEANIKQAGKILGRLDYSKKALHWKNCNAMELDASGSYYKNATGGGRAFRVGISKYFLEVIKTCSKR
ncbi:hypothetical protein ACU5EH_15095 [Aliivibrio salmonicida]|uniref:hypothetical protein n=1 Tax=Aliivibrio salmonicida TaxID=40269 RepID=UPI00406CE4F2